MIGRLVICACVMVSVVIGGISSDLDAAELSPVQVRLVVTGFKHRRGVLKVGLYNRANWLGDSGVVDRRVDHIKSDEVVFEYRNLPPGEYAIAAYYDENRNDDLDKGFLGIPIEPLGASNLSSFGMGAPSFDQCKFSVGSGPVDLNIRLKHAL